MDIYGSLDRTIKPELPDEYTELVAVELRSYILQDQLADDGEDKTLETLMKTAEKFLLDFQTLVNKNRGDPIWIHEWQKENAFALERHAENYQPLYKAISHLTETHYVAPWAMSFIIESCVANMVPDESTGEAFYDHYGAIGDEGREHYHYVVRFMENLVGRFFEAFMTTK